MRHFLAMAALAIRVVKAALAALLIPPTGLTQRLSAALLTAGSRAVPVTVIAKRTEEEHLSAFRTTADDESK